MGRIEAADIVPLGAEDAEAVMPLSAEAGWNQVPADWRFMLSMGQGVGVRDADGCWIGSGLVLPLGERTAWISMVLVAGRHRRHGIGSALLAHCFAGAESRGYLAGLDATELGRPVYLRYGFRDIYPLRRWRLDRPPAVVQAGAGVSIRSAASADMAALTVFDRPRSGLGRAPVIAHLLERRPGLAMTAWRGDKLAGYALGRDGRLATQIGPVVAETPATAIALVAAAMRAGAPPFVIDIPDAHADVTRWLDRHGATAPRGFMRMLRGSSAAVESPRHVFALAGPELA